MKRYKLKKDLPTFQAGDEFYLDSNNDLRLKVSDIMAYNHHTLEKIWHSRKQKNKYYAYMGKKFKRTFHWGEIKNEEEADRALTMTLEYLKEIK